MLDMEKLPDLERRFKELFGGWASDVRAANPDETIDVRYMVDGSLQITSDVRWDDPDAMWGLVRDEYLSLERHACDSPCADFELYGNDGFMHMAYPLHCGIMFEGTELTMYAA